MSLESYEDEDEAFWGIATTQHSSIDSFSAFKGPKSWWKNVSSQKRIVLGYFLFLILGLAPQLVQNLIFAETPVFTSQLPGGMWRSLCFSFGFQNSSRTSI